MEKTISDVFMAVSRELRHLAVLTSTLQDQMSPRGYDDLDIEAFQSIDSLNQTLDCLAIYVSHVGAQVACQSAVQIDDATDLVCLGELAERLRGDARTPPRIAVAEVELF